MKKKIASFATVVILTSISTNAFASTYVVQKGDTLATIAKKHNTSISNIKSLNHMKSDALFYNQTIKISMPAAVTPKQSAEKPSTDKNASTYTVVKGDSLSKIASNHKISLAELKSWNSLTSDMIYVGQKLKVSSTVTAPFKEKDKSIETTKQPPVPPASSDQSYIVSNGDSLSKIANQFNLSVQQLINMNNLNSDLIYIGQKLVVNGGIQSPSEQISQNEHGNHLDNSLIHEAMKLMGTPYVFGGSNADAFDCSGFIYYAFNQAGKSINRLSSQGYYDRTYYVDKPQTGDLVFFENTYKPGISHLGIYIGDNKFIHASPTNGVEINDLNHAYYKKHFESFKRFY